MNRINVAGLSKCYKKYRIPFFQAFDTIFPNRFTFGENEYVLSDINFYVKHGEALGIIGVNGSGKSTLLSIIAGITKPTGGNVEVNGRLSAILELGSGFHPDFTGRENILLESQILGLNFNRSSELIAYIQEFAGIGDYFDEPVRIYSSGMLSRLAFAVATATNPDVLIVDEALSVGDIAFQAKCMVRMNDMLDSGTTILFVSHSLNQVRQFCSKAMYIGDGHIKAFGAVDEICDLYQNDTIGNKFDNDISVSNETSDEWINLVSTIRDPHLRENSVGGDSCGDLSLEFLSFGVYNRNMNQIAQCVPDEQIVFKASIISNEDVPSGAAVGLLIADKLGYHLLSCNSNYYDVFLPEMGKGEVISISWVMHWPFYSGEFRVDIGIKPNPHSDKFYDRVFCAKVLECKTPAELVSNNFGGFLHVDAKVSLTEIATINE